MGTAGYALLAIIGFIAIKAFGAKSASVVPQGPASISSAPAQVDPATGAKIINTQPAGFVGPVQTAPRTPATDLGNGTMWCPYPLTLYKDLADGKFYCYNDKAPIDTTPTSDTSVLIDTSGYNPNNPQPGQPGFVGPVQEPYVAPVDYSGFLPSTPPAETGIGPTEYASSDYVQEPAGPNDPATIPTGGLFL